MQPGSSSANRPRHDWQRWTWDLRQSAPRSIHESHTPASFLHVTECNIRRAGSHVRSGCPLWPPMASAGSSDTRFPAKTRMSPSVTRLGIAAGHSSRRVTRLTPRWRMRVRTAPGNPSSAKCTSSQPVKRASQARRCSRSAGATRPRFSSGHGLEVLEGLAGGRCTSNAPTMLIGTSPSSCKELGQGT